MGNCCHVYRSPFTSILDTSNFSQQSTAYLEAMSVSSVEPWVMVPAVQKTHAGGDSLPQSSSAAATAGGDSSQAKEGSWETAWKAMKEEKAHKGYTAEECEASWTKMLRVAGSMVAGITGDDMLGTPLRRVQET